MLFIIFFFQVKNAIQKNMKLIHVNSNIDKKSSKDLANRQYVNKLKFVP